MNEKIEELFPKNSSFDDNHTVNTNEIVPEQIEVIAVNEYGKVDAVSLDYNEYRSELSSFYKMSTLENSIITTYIVNDDICNHKITFKNLSGYEDVKISKKFNYDTNFMNAFLVPMVEDYKKENIIFNSTIEVLDEEKANFIARTKSNDSLIIMGISIELANQLKDIVTRSDIPVNILDQKTKNESGIGTSLAIILTIIAIGMCLVGIIIFLVSYYKR